MLLREIDYIMEETMEVNSYELDDKQKKELIQSDISDMEDKLSGYQMNTEMKKAWISAIYPPKSDKNPYPSSESKGLITVEFLLPSDDTFVETFNYPDKRWPENNEFREFMEKLGYFNPNEINSMIGDSVDIKYNENINRWTIPIKYNSVDESDTDSDSDLDDKMVTILYIMIGFLTLLSIFSIFILRHFAILPIIFISIIIFIIYQFIQSI